MMYLCVWEEDTIDSKSSAVVHQDGGLLDLAPELEGVQHHLFVATSESNEGSLSAYHSAHSPPVHLPWYNIDLHFHITCTCAGLHPGHKTLGTETVEGCSEISIATAGISTPAWRSPLCAQSPGVA